jgi:PBP1b-binding outer membrane lipoprotein LpoB
MRHNLVAVLLGIFLLAGCAGQAKYELETPEGYKATVFNTKDIEAVDVSLTKSPDGTVDFSLTEKGISASTPMSIMAEQNKLILDKLLEAATP